MKNATLVKWTAWCSPRKHAKILAIKRDFPTIASEAKCLDIGTSTGGLMYWLKPQGQWTYADISMAALSVAQQLFRGEFATQSAEELIKDKSKTWDMVSLFDSAMYLTDPRGFFQNLGRTQPRLGWLVVSGVEEKSFFGWLRNKAGLKDADHFRHQISCEDFSKILTAAGYRLTKTSWFCGPMLSMIQVMQDRIFAKVSEDGKTDVSTVSRLDKEYSPIVMLPLLVSIVVTKISIFIDKLLPQKWNSGFVIVAQKI